MLLHTYCSFCRLCFSKTFFSLIASNILCLISVFTGGDWTSSTGDPIYENWADGQPTADGDCVALSDKDKKMANFRCSASLDYYCFLDNLVLVKEDKTWEEALEHCRAMDSTDPHRNDLISLSGPSDQHTVRSRVNEATTNEVLLLYFCL